MFSKTSELCGAGLISFGVAYYLGVGAALIFGGVTLIFVGAMTNDEALGLVLRRGSGWIRYAWHRQLLAENGIQVPDLKSARGFVRCECDGDFDCPICEGKGFLPDPALRVGTESPHPPIRVNPQSQEFWGRLAKARTERAKVRDRTPALSRQDANGNDDDYERLA